VRDVRGRRTNVARQVTPFDREGCEMDQRTVILQSWRRASQRATAAQAVAQQGAAGRVALPPAPQSKAVAFFEMVRKNPEPGWEALCEVSRRNYYAAINELSPPMLALDDPLITLNIVRFADLNQPREVEILKQLILDADPEKHQFALRELAERGGPELQEALRRKANLPGSEREVLERPPARGDDPASSRRGSRAGKDAESSA